jgi:hypothetical protein
MKKTLKYKKKTHKKNSKKSQRFRKTLKYKKNSKQFHKKSHKKTHKKYYKKYLGGMRVKNKSTGKVRDEDDNYELKEGEKVVDICAICLDDDTTENPLVTLHTPPGNAEPHKFHVACVKALPEWNRIPHRLPLNCPFCRTPVSNGPLIEQLRAEAQAAREEVVSTLNEKLIEACSNGNTELAVQLIEEGADVNAKSHDDGETALMAASIGGHISCIDMLVVRGADVNATDKNGMTALMVASQTGRIRCIEMLIARGAYVNAKDNDGWTALMYASQKGDVICVKMLIERGADVNAKDNNGDTALSHANDVDHDDIATLLKQHGAA